MTGELNVANTSTIEAADIVQRIEQPIDSLQSTDSIAETCAECC